LGEACGRFGGLCHAFALMTNHVHIVIEDVRGTLSQLMHHVASCYAQYFNTTREGRRRRGPLFENRFDAQLIDSHEYFEAACAYVLLNPMRTQRPLASAPEAYRWSSASLVCGDVSPEAFSAGLLATVGGIEAALARLPRTRRKESTVNRRARLDALASGVWIERERLLGGRTPQQYQARLAEQLGAAAADADADAAGQGSSSVPARTGRAVAWPVGENRARFAGLPLEGVRGRIEEAVERLVPRSMAEVAGHLTDVISYALFRFSSASLPELATALETTLETMREAVCRIRGEVTKSAGWRRLLWGLEWGLRWRLRAGPHRA
jgi:hypothetical protein